MEQQGNSREYQRSLSALGPGNAIIEYVLIARNQAVSAVILVRPFLNGRRDTLSLLATIRLRCVRKGRGFLTLLSLAWLNVILQPCAMAMADAITCPDCPPAHINEQVTAGPMEWHDHAMTMHEEVVGHGSAVEHDMNSGGEPCAGELLDCVNLEDISQTARQEQPSPEPGMVWIVPVPEQPRYSLNYRASPSFCLGDPVRLAGAFPPLNVLHCVYLD
ncbi:MAG: hypothetical protein GTO41_24065 [Burkholderiales bacterium]|nr:hypothetical protein [Burkholderiales bacterium]